MSETNTQETDTQETNTQDPKDKQLEMARADVAEFYSANEHVYYVRDVNKFYEYNPTEDRWYTYTPEGLRNGSRLVRAPLNFKVFQNLLEDEGKIFKTITYSVRPDADPHALNLIVKDAWIQPEELTLTRTPNTKWFDYLMMALGNNDEKQIRHIKQVVAWKWLHPEDVTLPCLCFYGEGRAGKGILAQEIFTTIFSKNASFTGKMNSLERFNGPLVGRLIFNFDETIKEKANLEFIKSIVGAREISVELKGREQMMVENTALYMISSNSYSGAMRLEHNSAQDRWSFLKLTTTLAEIVAVNEGLGPFEPNDESKDSVKSRALALINNAVKNVFRSRSEVAVFLAECVQEVADLETAPRAFHGDNLTELMEIGVDPVDVVCTQVFKDYADFQWISIDTLYKLYTTTAKEVGSLQKGLGTFSGDVEAWLQSNRLSNSIKRAQRERVNFGNVRKQQTLFKRVPDDAKRKIDNSDFFLNGGHLMVTDDGSPDPQAHAKSRIGAIAKHMGESAGYYKRLHEEALKQREMLESGSHQQ